MIRQELLVWKRATESLLLTIEEVHEDERDEAIERVEQLLDVRDQFQKNIQAPFTKEEEAFGKEVIQLEQQFQQQLQRFFKSIGEEISVTQSKKSNMQSYINPYQNVARDGSYYDAKQ